MERRLAQAIDAAKLYYGRGVSQDVIAQTLGVSRPTVSKLIALAKAQGFVRVTIHDPREATSDLGAALVERYGLADVRLAVDHDEPDAPHDQLGGVGAQLVHELVGDDTRIGLAWGRPVHAVGRYLTPRTTRGVQVVQLQGGVPRPTRPVRDHETTALFCEAFDARARSLYVPLHLDDAAVRDAVAGDRHVRSVLEAGRQVDLAVFSVAPVTEESPALALGYVDGTDRELLLRDGLAEVAGHYLDATGAPCLPGLEDRTMAVDLADLRAVPQRVCVAGGRSQVRALAAVLAGGLVTHLVTDVTAAEALLAEHA